MASPMRHHDTTATTCSCCCCKVENTSESSAQYCLCQYLQPCYEQHSLTHSSTVVSRTLIHSNTVVSHTDTWIVFCRRTQHLKRLWLYLCICICLLSSSSFVSGKSVGGGTSIPSVEKTVNSKSVFPVDTSEEMETGTPVFMELAGSPFSSEDNTALWW